MTAPSLIAEATEFLNSLPAGLPSPQVYAFLEGEAGVVWHNNAFDTVEVKVYGSGSPKTGMRGQFVWLARTNGTATAAVTKTVGDEVAVASVVKAVQRLGIMV